MLRGTKRISAGKINGENAMFLRLNKRYIACIAAICATSSFTVLLLCAGIAAACEGGGGGECSEAPTVTTTAASSITYTSAYLNGQVKTNGCETTSYQFEIKKSTSPTWIENGTHYVLSESISEFEPFLQPNTAYEYRLKATNIAGSKTGSIVKFSTLAEPPPGEKPSVTTEAATGITSSGATLNGFVNPHGLSTTYKFEYGTTKESLTKSTAPVNMGTESKKVKTEVNLEPGTLYYFRISASNSIGTTPGGELSFTTSATLWKIKETLNTKGASDSNLYDVSCNPSTKACTAVGKSTTSGVDSPMVQRWNGTSWSEQTPAKKSGSAQNRLFGVDCPSETRCLAVGSYQNSEGGPATLGELWNESKWTVQTTPVPSEATSSELVAVGCNNTAECVAAGSAVVKGVKSAIAEEWNSPTWTLSTVPIPKEASSSQFDGVDCLWSNFCVAVGRYTTSGGSIKSLVEFWDGTEWKLQTVADPEGAAQSTLLDVACTPTPNRCTAVGGWKNSKFEQFTLAYRFNGVTTWTLQSTPNPAGSIASVFQEASCATETSCTAAGSWVSGSGGSNQTLAEVWNGTSWSIQGTPNPAGATFSAFFGASCLESSCFGVGWSTDALGVDTTLAEFRE
jgi:hypothetical protein